MMQRAIWIALVAVGSAAMLAAQGSPSPDVLLKQATQLQQVDGDVRGAAAAYRRIADQFATQTAIASQALLRLADAERWLGNVAAEQQVLGEIVARYAAEPAARSAQARLAAGSAAQTATSGALAPRRLPLKKDGDLSQISFSRDGRSMVAIDWISVIVMDVASQESRVLQAGQCDSDGLCAHGDGPVLSADSQQVAYTWYDDRINEGRGNLRIVANSAGATPKTVAEHGELSFWPAAWTPDGKSILVRAGTPSPGRGSSSPAREWQIGVVSVDTGYRALKSLGWWGPSGVALSPDGRYVAYAALASPPSHQPPLRPGEPTDQHIYVLPLDGAGPEIELVKTAGINQNPVWTPDGSHLLFVSDRSGTLDLWAVPVRNGRSAGHEQLVRKDLGETDTVVRSEITTAGTFYYGKRQPGFDRVTVAEMQRPGTQLAGGTLQIAATVTGTGAVWAPDGKSFAFTKLGATPDIVVHSMDTGAERSYSKRGIPGGAPGAWFRDGSAFLTVVVRDDGARWLERVNVASREFTPLFSLSPSLAPGQNQGIRLIDDNTVVMMSREPNGSDPRGPLFGPINRIVALDLSGRQKDVFVVPSSRAIAAFAVSRSGRSIALVIRRAPNQDSVNEDGVGRIAIVGIDGTGYREIYVADYELSLTNSLAWTADDSALLFAMRDSNLRRVMQVPVTGGVPQFTGVAVTGTGQFTLTRLDVSPDGSQLAYVSRPDPVHEVWAIDNLLQSLK